MSLSHHPSIVKNGLVLYLDAANYKSYPAAQDAYVNNVSLMLDGESLTDKSQNNFTVTNSSAAVSSAQVKYGNSSIYFNGSSFVSVPDSSAFSFGTGDFTIETWLKLGAAITATSGDASFRSIVNKYSAGSNGTEDAFYVYLNNAAGTMQLNVGFVSNTTASNFAFNITGVDTSLNSVWNHIAVVRSSGSLKVYFNGTQIGSTQTYSSSINQGNLPLLVGARTYAPYDLYLNGYIDDLRITKAAIYTANFTPPSGPLRLPGQIIDLTKNKAIGTLTNGPTYSGGNLVFDGTNDYITSPTSTLFNFGTGDFTIEMWVYPTSVKTFSLLDFRINETNPNGNAFVIGTSASNLWVVYQAGNQITGPTVVANQWTQVVVTRVGTAVKMFLNGVQIGSTWTTSNTFTDGAFVLGTDYPLNARFFQGSLSSVKIYKGKGLSNNEILQNYNAIKARFGY